LHGSGDSKWNYGGEIETSVIPMLNYSEVAMGVLGESKSMVGSSEGCLQIAQEHVEPSEGIFFAAGLALAIYTTLYSNPKRAKSRNDR
jgi:hypothetical protein